MQLDWTTFILEILNFLVLVWILQRFLYRPVLDLLAARQQKIREASEQAQKQHDEAETLRLHYESRLADWHQECEHSRLQLNEQLALLKTQEMAKLKQALADEEEKLRVRNETLLAAREAELLRSAANQAYGEAARMLNRLASPELTQRIAAVLLQDLAALPENDRALLCKAAGALKENEAATIVSAHSLDLATRAAIETALVTVSGKILPAAFSEDPELIAGLRAIVGECVLHANLADELEFFRRQANHVR
ncbi:F0F1 ATP synthase subunit delta [Methylomicrobium sp. Wu6]|uniref:F0F1 ATP synthase subunit delta n=1 Tax=Methylomicrobium sp. Wu6 TaxID=3107928 RepID=UPI002DD6B8B4|nr:F0F1 ATP synthase subunit delta [Methylomicrobium sp. Wu6]MEC4749926.1 F0F1 ATP synthase subunit delta [Methylomicrobium sp. Wu6]